MKFPDAESRGEYVRALKRPPDVVPSGSAQPEQHAFDAIRRMVGRRLVVDDRCARMVVVNERAKLCGLPREAEVHGAHTKPGYGAVMGTNDPTDIWTEVAAERARAHAKHGDKSMESADYDAPIRLSILMEEVGELAREFNEAAIHGRDPDRAKMRAELIQVAAMAGAWADVL